MYKGGTSWICLDSFDILSFVRGRRFLSFSIWQHLGAGHSDKLRTTKSERSFEIQPHLVEHALHWKVGGAPKAGILEK